MNNDFLSFKEDGDFQKSYRKKWKVLIVDDDLQVHKTTKIVLDDFTFENKSLKFISAYSAQEAVEILKDNPDTAVILLDVVMEEDDSGFKVVKYIREKLKNTSVRIILKTGQPGIAPERDVISNYDINDYREKTELTDDRFFTAMTSALRAYRDITALLKSRHGLEMIIRSTVETARFKSLNQLASGVLMQLGAVLGTPGSSFFCMTKASAERRLEKEFMILAATGGYSGCVSQDAGIVVEGAVFKDIMKAYNLKTNLFEPQYSILYFTNKFGMEGLIFAEGLCELNEDERELVHSFCMNFSAAFDNVHVGKEVVECLMEACAIIDTAGRIISCNRAFEREFSFYAGRAESADSSILIEYLKEFGDETNDREVILNAIRQHGPCVEGELTVGKIRKVHYSVTVRSLKDARDNEIGRVVMFYDISSYKQLLNELKEKNLRLEELNCQQNKYLSAMERMKAFLDDESMRMDLHTCKIANSLIEIFGKMEEYVIAKRSPRSLFHLAGLFRRTREQLYKTSGAMENLQKHGSIQFEKMMECIADAERYISEQIRANVLIPDDFLDLTDVKILKLIAKGKSNKEIAQSINFEEGSIKNRIGNMIKKVLPDGQGDKRCMLVSYAYEMGFVDEYIFIDEKIAQK